MTVDVLLPTYRRAQTLPYALQAVLRQTHQDLRLHVVGDGCTAEVEKAVRSVDDARVRFYRLPKAKGYGYANRNHVLREGTAPCVAYATDDDLWFPDHLERAVGALDQGLDLVAFRSCSLQPPNQLEIFFFAFDWGRTLQANLLRDWFIGSPEFVHRRRLFDTAGYWNDALTRFGDRDMYQRLRRSTARSAYIDYLTVLRFYALHWEARYGDLDAPPQREYLDKLGDPEWCRRVREKIRQPRRTSEVRYRQLRDFLRFGARSGPRLVRYWYEWMRRATAQ